MSNSVNPIRIARVGYGPGSSIRLAHNELIQQTDGLVQAAVCDTSEQARQSACDEIGGDLAAYDSLETLLADDVADLCLLVTPHNTHADLAIQCLEAGKHVVIDKPFGITYEETQAVMAAAERAGKLVTVFHNRRWDGDFQAMRRVIVEEKLLGDVFHIEGYRGGFKPPRGRWRDVRDVSGGSHYDWGAHGIDQALQLLPGCTFDTIYGIQHQDRVFPEMSNEDQIQSIVRFAGGEVLDLQISRIAHANRPAWRVLGTKGALVSWGGSSLTLYSKLGDHDATAEIKCGANEWGGFYRNLAGHLLRDEPLVITPEDAARVVAVLDYTSRSAREGRMLKMPCR